jgi:hypothetical protein
MSLGFSAEIHIFPSRPLPGEIRFHTANHQPFPAFTVPIDGKCFPNGMEEIPDTIALKCEARPFPGFGF